MNDCIRAGHVNCWFTDGTLVLALCENCMAYKNDAPDALRFSDLSKAIRLDLHPNPPIGNPIFPGYGLPPDLSIQKIRKWQEASSCETPEELWAKSKKVAGV